MSWFSDAWDDFTGAGAAEDAAKTQRKQIKGITANLAPWVETGQNALSDYYSKLQAGPGQFQESPQYQFNLEQGEQAINRSAAGRNNAMNPATTKALMKYGSGLASGEYQNWLSNYYTNLNQYANLSGQGLNASAQQPLYSGNAQIAAGQMTGNANIGLVNSASNLASSIVDNSTAQNYLNALLGNRSTGSGNWFAPGYEPF